MLNTLSIQNFKSWREIDHLRLAPITGMFGTNSSGKSSILQFLLLLKQTVESTDRAQVLNLGSDRSLVELGTFGDVVYEHDTSRHVSFLLSWGLPPRRPWDLNQSILLLGNPQLEFAASLADLGNGRVVVREMEYRFSGRHAGMRLGSDGDYSLYPFDENGFQKKYAQENHFFSAPNRFYGFPGVAKSFYRDASSLADFELALEEQFEHIYYLGPLRDHPKREYTWAGGWPSDVGQRGERVIEAILASRERDETPRVEERVAHWLRELGLIHDFSVEEIASGTSLYRVWVRKTPEAAKVLLTDVGFGVSQILPVIALCYYVPQGSTIILEQPEIHLHPSVQAGLADVFVDAIKTRGVQIILESHSEHLLRRLQRRIAEEELSRDDVALYFCEMKHGASEITPLEVDAFGQIANWPRDFFGDEFGEMAAMAEAIVERKAS